MAAAVGGIAAHEWVRTAAEQDAAANNIAHAFLSTTAFANSHAVFRLLRELRPGAAATLSAGRYEPGHWIEPHDDRAYRPLLGVLHSRTVALVYHLSRDWRPARSPRARSP